MICDQCGEEDKMPEGACIVRAQKSGVFVCEVDRSDPNNSMDLLEIKNSRKIHYWNGAGGPEGLALHGSSDIDSCRITGVIESQPITEVIQIIRCSPVAYKILMEAKVWRP